MTHEQIKARCKQVAVTIRYALTNRDIDWKCCLEEQTGAIPIMVTHLESLYREAVAVGLERAMDYAMQEHHTTPDNPDTDLILTFPSVASWCRTEAQRIKENR